MKKFKINNMQDLYDERILKRGYDYYNEGRIKSATCSSDNLHLVKFKIQGIEMYTAYILMDKKDQNVLKMKCNCPYKFNCKHTAAALYYLKDGREINIKVNKIIKNKFQNELDTGLVFVLDGQSITSIDGFFQLLDQKVYEIEEDLYNRKTKIAADNLFYLLDKIDLVNKVSPSFCFDYEGDIVITNNYDLNDIEDLIQKCIYQIFLDDKKILEKKIIQYCKKKSLWKHDISFFLDPINEKASYDDQLILLDIIDDLLKIHLYKYSKDYLNYLKAKINLITLNNNKYLIKARKVQRYNPFIRQLLIDYYIDNNLEKEAIKLIKYDDTIYNYQKLLEIYEYDEKKYNETLLEMYYKYPSIDIFEEIIERKIKVNKKTLLKQLLHDNLNYGEIEFFIKNGFEDYMFNYLINNNIDDLLRFTSFLKYKYNNELKEIIIEKINDLIVDVRYKKTYNEVIKLLFKLNELDNGKKECKKIINEIKKSQPNNTQLLRSLLYFKKTVF